MSLDSRISDAVEDLRRTTVDTTTGLERLRKTHLRRTATRAVTAGCIAVLLAAGAISQLSGPPRQPDPAPELPHISNGVLVSIEDTDKVVALGGSLRHLPNGMAMFGHLAFSPDGNELVHNTADGHLVALDVETGDVRILTTCTCVAGASPDTSRIAEARETELRIHTEDGDSVVQLPSIPAGGNPGVPVWSPDGTRIALARPIGLYVVDADGSGLERLVPFADTYALPVTPSWSPDGRSLVYLTGEVVAGTNPSGGDTRYFVDTIDLTDGTTRRLASAGRCFCMTTSPAVAWSPDGALVAFVRVGNRAGLFSIPTEGGKAERLSEEKVGGALAWQPILD